MTGEKHLAKNWIQKMRSVLGWLVHSARAKLALFNATRKKQMVSDDDLSRGNWDQSLKNPSKFYLDCVSYFYDQFPGYLKVHRRYFSESGRGFGEDAFHVMWWLLVREYRPKSFLEIGVYRGQTLSLVSLLQKNMQISGSVTGISPFQPIGDGVSQYRSDIDYFSDTLASFSRLELPKPDLVKALSTDSAGIKAICAHQWDIIYIDGNHDYEIAKQDFQHCTRALAAGGILVLDDAGLTTSYRPPAFATGGHPGPSRLAQEIDPLQYREILQVGHNRVFQRIA